MHEPVCLIAHQAVLIDRLRVHRSASDELLLAHLAAPVKAALFQDPACQSMQLDGFAVSDQQYRTIIRSELVLCAASTLQSAIVSLKPDACIRHPVPCICA